MDVIVRLYDGADNPIGKAIDKPEFMRLLEPHFKVDAVYYHFFPAHSLPVHLTKRVHRVLDTQMPFRIYANITKH